MKQIRDNSTVIKSLLTKQQRILTKFNSERVIDIGRQSEGTFDSASDFVENIWHPKKAVGLFTLGKVKRQLNEYSHKNKPVKPLDRKFLAAAFLTKEESQEFNVGLLSYPDPPEKK